MNATRGDEPGGSRAEHELEHRPSLVTHLQAAAVVVNSKHDALLDATAEVLDTPRRADAGQLSRRFEHA